MYLVFLLPCGLSCPHCDVLFGLPGSGVYIYAAIERKYSLERKCRRPLFGFDTVQAPLS